MNIIRHRPITRGVTELMYVGDDEAVEKATSHTTATMMMVSMGVGLWLSFFGKSKAAKTIGGALVIVPVAAELYYHATGTCAVDRP